MTDEELDQLYEPPEPTRAHPLISLVAIVLLGALCWLPFLGGCW